MILFDEAVQVFRRGQFGIVGQQLTVGVGKVALAMTVATVMWLYRGDNDDTWLVRGAVEIAGTRCSHRISSCRIPGRLN
jgi:hypothetical protein